MFIFLDMVKIISQPSINKAINLKYGMTEYDLSFRVHETNDALTIAEKCREIFTSVRFTLDFGGLQEMSHECHLLFSFHKIDYLPYKMSHDPTLHQFCSYHFHIDCRILVG